MEKKGNGKEKEMKKSELLRLLRWVLAEKPSAAEHILTLEEAESLLEEFRKSDEYNRILKSSSEENLANLIFKFKQEQGL